MNTQLKERPTTQTKAPSVRPRPVWTEPAEARRPTPPARRVNRWIALFVVVLMAGAAAAVVSAVTGDGSTPDPVPTQRPAFDSPGGNSLNIPSRAAAPTRPVFDSPGGNSLNMP